MKLHILSDLHNEFSVFDPIATDADVVVLAGDIGPQDSGIRWARKAFQDTEIVYVPGNHEFYGHRRTEVLQCMAKSASELGVYLLDDAEVNIGGVRFLGATLWTDFRLFGEESQLAAMREGSFYLNDFRLIGENVSERFTAQRSLDLHNQSLKWLHDRLDETFDGKTVVVSHHLPSMLSVAENFQDSLLSACFASNLDGLFGRMQLWVHGHTHSSMEYITKGTRVVCNPRGYVTNTGIENFDFNPSKIVLV